MEEQERTKIDKSKEFMDYRRRDVDDNISSDAKKGILWTFWFNGFQLLIHFCGSIILARILFPEDFGLMAIVSIILQLSRRLTNFGFNMVLIQRKTIRKEHFETVFFVNFVLMLIISSIVFTTAFYIGSFFQNERIVPLLKVISLNFILEVFSGVPIAILRRKMEFKAIEIARTIGELIAVISPIFFAINGFGVWSLVIGSLLSSATKSVVFTCYSRWVPKFRFYLWALKDVFAFGLWVYIGGYVNYGVNKIDFFLVGKVLNATQLGLYERAFNLISFPQKKIAKKINSVLFSAYSRIQDEDERMVKGMLKVVTHISLITYPLMTWMFFVAPSLITILYGSKWSASIPPLQIMCLAGVLNTLSLIMWPILLARGLVGHRTRRNFVYLIILSSCVFIGTRWGIVGVAWGTTVASFFQLGIMLNLTIRNLPFTIWDFFRVQKAAIISSLILALSLTIFQAFEKLYISEHSIVGLVSETFLSALIVILTQLIFRFKDIDIIFRDFYKELRKFKNQIPVIGRLI